MPNLINTDNAGNVFYNYITPVVKGVTSTIYVGNNYSTDFETLITTSGNTFNTYTAYNSDWLGNATWVNYRIRFAAPGLETRSDTRYRTNLSKAGGRYFPNNASGSAAEIVDYTILSAQNMSFCCFNQYAFVIASFNGVTTSPSSFQYIGYLREPSYDDAFSYPRGFVSIHWHSGGSVSGKRVNIENVAATTNLSTAANSITSPPIVCTTGTDPGDGSETFTDVVIRDAAAPNNPVGKLWNCIDMPATCNVGELWRNTGAHDGDASASEQDTYLCIMPWGTRKLGMRVWTENVS